MTGSSQEKSLRAVVIAVFALWVVVVSGFIVSEIRRSVEIDEVLRNSRRVEAIESELARAWSYSTPSENARRIERLEETIREVLDRYNVATTTPAIRIDENPEKPR